MTSTSITRIAVTGFAWTIADIALEPTCGLDWIYSPGAKLELTSAVLVVETASGVRAEVPGGIDARTASYLLGRDALRREEIWQDLKRSERLGIASPPGAVDTALWDIAGKIAGLPIAKLLGGFRDRIPCYASTYHADDADDGLSSPEAFADFALACRALGYPGFKVHGWIDTTARREAKILHTVRQAVGDEMALMSDPAGALSTFTDALYVGRACDDADFFWYEDPLRGGGFSQFASKKLRESLRTPLLIGEHLRSFEAKADAIVAGATDFVRACANIDGGITGVMKLAALAEAFGLDVELHGPGLPHRHCLAAIKNTNFYEMGLVHPEVPGLTPPVFADPRWWDTLDVVDSEGCVAVPSEPGLGATIAWDFVRAHEVGTTVYE